MLDSGAGTHLQAALLPFHSPELCFAAAFDFVTLVQWADGRASRLYSSPSHRALGHDPSACNGDVADLLRLHGAQLAEPFAAEPPTDGQRGEMCLLHADGREVWCEYRVQLEPGATGSGRCLVFARDLTATREVERLQQVNEQQANEFKRMVDHVPAMVYSYTTDENNENPRFPAVSMGAELVYGIKPEAIMADPAVLIGIIHPEDLGTFIASVNESWETLLQWTWTGRFLVGSGEYKWMKCSSMPLRQANGHTTWYGAVFDISASVELERSRAELDSLVRSANAPIFQIDLHGIVGTCNPTAVDMLGYAREGHIVGRAFLDFVPAEARPTVGQVLASALGGKETKAFELELLSEAGESVQVLLNATARRDTAGEVLGIVCVGQDVTQVRLQAEEKKILQTEKKTVAEKYARALDSLTDVVFEVSASSWTDGDWLVGERSASFRELFAVEPGVEAWVLDLVQEPEAMRNLLWGARSLALSTCELSVVKPNTSRNLTVHFQV